MKKTILSLAILSIVFIFKNTDKLIIGSWDNTSTSVEKLDEVSEALFQANISYLQQQKDLYTSQMQTVEDSNKANYEQIIANIDTQIAELNVDTIKNNIINNYNIGTFIFNKDKTLTIKNKQDSIIGIWTVNEDTLNITIQNEEIPLFIKNINKKKLVLVQNNNLDSLKFDITYYFEKK